MTQSPPPHPQNWTGAPISALLAPLEDGRILHQGWSPQCEKEARTSHSEWGVLKTTAIQSGAFQPEHNKRLPDSLTPRPHLEVKEGDLLITCAGPRSRCGVACLVKFTPPRLTISGKMYRFRAREDLADPRYLEAFLQAPVAQLAIDGMKTGVSDSGLNLTHDRFLPLLVPLAPLPEQRRIVEVLESNFARLDAAVAALERVRANLKRYRASVLEAASTGGLVKVESPWQFSALGEIAEIRSGIQKQPSRAPRLNSHPFLRVANVLRGRLDLGEIHDVELFDGELEKLRLARDDLLVVEGNGSPSEIGRMAIWDGSIEGCVHQNHIIRARIEGKALPKFIETFWNSPSGSEQVKAVSSSTSGLYTLSAGKVGKIRVPLPSLEEQRRIVGEVDRQISVVQESETEVEAGIMRCISLRHSVLKVAFEGKLVPQDPTDEPASVLLKRIERERSQLTPVASHGRKSQRRTNNRGDS